MGQLSFNNQKPKYCNLYAITSGSKASTKPDNGEVWLVDTSVTTSTEAANDTKVNGAGYYDSYIIGDGIKTCAQLAATALQKIDAYQKPSGGIPKTDLASDVQTSLNKADSALQSHQNISGKADKATTLAGYGITDAYTKTEVDTAIQEGGSEGVSVDNALSDSSINPVQNNIIKAALDTKDNKVAVVNHGTSDTIFALTPNVMHVWGEVTTLTLTLVAGEAGMRNEYMFKFFSGSTPTTLTLPAGVSWVQPLTTQQDKTYEISIVDNLAAYITSSMVAAESQGGTPEYASKNWVETYVSSLDGGIYYE